MITTIYQDGQEIIVPDGAHKDDIVIVNGKKYKVIAQENPKYDSYYVAGPRSFKYFWGFEEVDE